VAQARPGRKIAAAALVVLGVAAALVSPPSNAWLRGLQAWIQGMGTGGMLLYAAFYVVAVLLFVPGIPLTLGAGFLFGVARGLILVSATSTAAATLAFLLARRLARSRVERLARRSEKFAAIDRAIGREGWKVVVLLRLSPVVPFSLSNYLYGLTKIRLAPYALASWLAMLPQTALYVSLGAAGASLGEARSRGVWEWGLLGAGIAATAAATVILARAAGKELARDAPKPASSP